MDQTQKYTGDNNGILLREPWAVISMTGSFLGPQFLARDPMGGDGSLLASLGCFYQIPMSRLLLPATIQYWT